MTELRRPAGSPRFDDLPDVNLRLAMAVTQHPHHETAASDWKQLAGKRDWFCRVTMLGLVRLLAQPKVMGDPALTLAEALAAYHRFASLPEIGFHAEPANCAAELERRLSADLPARLLTDAYLAAFAEFAGLRMVTFDKDFERFPGLDCLRLPTASH